MAQLLQGEAALLTPHYLEERARRGSRARFDEVLSRVPAAEPHPDDGL